MKNIFSRTCLFELVNNKSGLVVEVRIQTRPNNELINTAILGMISSSICVVDAISIGGARQKVFLDLDELTRVYSRVIIPSISDEGNIKAVIRENKLEVVYGSCNNIIRIFPKLAEIGEVVYTNIEIAIVVKQIKGNTRLSMVTGVIKDELVK